MSETALQDQIAVVTGAGSGLGVAIARRLAAEGAHVVVNDLHADAAEVVAKEIDGEVATEVAALVRYLVCDATYSFGEILPVSGGWLA